MNGGPAALEGEIARAFAQVGFSFALQRTQVDGKDLRLFLLAFEHDSGEMPVRVTAYLSGSFFIAGCSLRAIRPIGLERVSDEATRSTPMVRIVKAPAAIVPPGETVYWVEATSILHAPPWEGDAGNMAAVPVSVVAGAVRVLLNAFRDELELATNVIPYVEIGMEPPLATTALKARRA